MKCSDAIESFTHAGRDYWCRRNAKGELIYAEATGSFKGAGSRVISAGEYRKHRRHPAASVPKG